MWADDLSQQWDLQAQLKALGLGLSEKQQRPFHPLSLRVSYPLPPNLEHLSEPSFGPPCSGANLFPSRELGARIPLGG